ncbi:unnamed protein product, partial [Brenthis ino]
MIRSPTNKDGKYSSQPDLASTNKTDSESSSSFVAVRKRKERSEFEELREEIQILITTIKTGQEAKFEKIFKSIEELKLQNNTLKIQNEKILSSNEIIEKKLMQTTELYNDVKKTMAILQDDHNKAINKITALEEEVEEIQRHHRSSFIEITTPINENENILEMVTNIHETIGFKPMEESIRQCYRMKQGTKKPILVEYRNGQKRNEVLKLAKIYNKNNKEKLNTDIFGKQKIKERIYINEFLTPNTRKLYYHARQLQKLHGFKYYWVSRGRVYIRKNDGDPAILVKSLEQIESLKVEATI